MNEERKQKLIRLCSQMIRIPSVTGEEKSLVEFLKTEMESLGFDEVKIDKIGNIIGRIKGKRAGKTILFDGHLDTVAASNLSSWTRDPFGAEIEKGRIYGRGTSDMKGSLAAMIMAAAFLKNDGGAAGDVYISGTVFEEVAEGCALNFVLDEVHPDTVIIGESTELNLNIGQRGRAEIIIKTKGIPAHSSNPGKGVNAVYKMIELIEKINNLPESDSSVLGRGSMVLTDIISSPYPGASVIPEFCTTTFDRRLLPGETTESVLKPLKEIIEKLKEEDETFSAEAKIAEITINTHTHYQIEHSKFAPAWICEHNDAMIKSALKALKDSGLASVATGTYSFCTNGSSSAGLHAIPTLGFGPGRENQAHVNDEYIEIEEMIAACNGYYALASALTVQKEK